MLVKDVNGQSDFAHQLGALLDGQRAGGFEEIHTFDELHDEMRNFIAGAEAVDGDDVGMADLREGASFLHEAGADGRVLAETFTKSLDGDLAIQAFILSEQDAAHSAGADFSQDGVAGERFRKLLADGGRTTGELGRAVHIVESDKQWTQFLLQRRVFAAESVQIDKFFS